MGSAVSAGEDNDDLIDNLVEADYIKSVPVECIFRAVDRANYYADGCKENAYRDLAWKNGNLHLSAPCIYSEVMESLRLEPGLSFLNLGSGTGYLSTMVGLVLGPYGINHGIELHQDVVDYAQEKLVQFKGSSPALDKYEFCDPKFAVGNCLLIDTSTMRLYDRVYCGASCPPEHENYMKNLIKVGGILVMPLNDQLLQIIRTGESSWDTKSVLPVSFASLVMPSQTEAQLNVVKLPEASPLSLKEISRSIIRVRLRKNAENENPSIRLKSVKPRRCRRPRSNGRSAYDRRNRRIVIPLFDSDHSNDSHHNSTARHNGEPSSASSHASRANRALRAAVVSFGQMFHRREAREGSAAGNVGTENAQELPKLNEPNGVDRENNTSIDNHLHGAEDDDNDDEDDSDDDEDTIANAVENHENADHHNHNNDVEIVLQEALNYTDDEEDEEITDLMAATNSSLSKKVSNDVRESEMDIGESDTDVNVNEQKKRSISITDDEDDLPSLHSEFSSADTKASTSSSSSHLDSPISRKLRRATGLIFKRVALADFDSDSDSSCDTKGTKKNGNDNESDDDDEVPQPPLPEHDNESYTYAMRQKINLLPLPQSLKFYLNFNRKF